MFVKGAESSVLPKCIGGEIEKTRVHVDEFALVSVNFSDTSVLFLHTHTRERFGASFFH